MIRYALLLGALRSRQSGRGLEGTVPIPDDALTIEQEIEAHLDCRCSDRCSASFALRA
jgi:hypothetical protein